MAEKRRRQRRAVGEDVTEEPCDSESCSGRSSHCVYPTLKREDLPPVSYYLSTGSTLLDLAISDRLPGGAGGGRITHIYGDNSTAKTLLIQEVMGAAQREGGTVILCDAEWAFDYGRAHLFGLDVGKWASESYQDEQTEKESKASDDKKKRMKFYQEQLAECDGFLCRHPESVESLFDCEIMGLVDAVKAGVLKPPIILAVDSLSALASIVENEDDLDTATYGITRAKMFSAGFRKYIKHLAKYKIAVVAVDQTRMDVGSPVKNKRTTSGGRSMGFYCSTGVLLSHVGYLSNKHEVKTGVKIKFIVKKNKIAAPFREGILDILFDVGVDDVTANLEWLAGQKEVDSKLEQSGAWYSWGEMKLGQGLDSAVRMVEREDMEEDVEQEVKRVWEVIYSPSGRKKRHG